MFATVSASCEKIVIFESIRLNVKRVVNHKLQRNYKFFFIMIIFENNFKILKSMFRTCLIYKVYTLISVIFPDFLFS